MSRYVISLGGNALGNNAQQQLKKLIDVAKPIVKLIEDGHQVVIVHGNGPQVGMINLAFSESSSTPDMPFPECGAMSQGYIGYHIQNAITNALKQDNSNIKIATVITQIIVDKDDPHFNNPTKPIGSFYSKEEMELIINKTGYTMKEDSGRGYRRVIASPLPVDVVEKDIIKTLLDNNHVVVCAGGGGIPVILENDLLFGIDAVIDKDFASAKIAELIDADYLVILTAVDNVYINFNRHDQLKLEKISNIELAKHIAQNHFAKGSMLPKVQASLSFVNSGINKIAVISSIEQAVNAFALQAGTIITQ
jgi:carbamate kinase